VAECEANIRIVNSLALTAQRILEHKLLDQTGQDGFNATRVVEMLLEGTTRA
jgi:hypothetical protein